MRAIVLALHWLFWGWSKLMAVKHLVFVWIFRWHCPHLIPRPEPSSSISVGCLQWGNERISTWCLRFETASWERRNDSKLGISMNLCKALFYFCESKVDFLSYKKEIIEEKSRYNRQSWQVPRKTPSPLHVPITPSFYVLRVMYERNCVHPRFIWGLEEQKKYAFCPKLRLGRAKQKEAMMLL